MRYANVAIESYSILICLILLVYQIFHMTLYKRQKYWFLLLLVANITLAAGDMTDWLCTDIQAPAAILLHKGGMVLFYVSTAFLSLGLTGYLMEFMGLNSPKSRFLWKVAVACFVILVACSVLSSHFRLFFYFDGANVYQRGNWYLLSQMLPMIMYLIDIALIAEGKGNLHSHSVFFLSSFIFLPLLGQIIQAKYYGIAGINPMVTIAILLSVINVQREQELEVKEQEKELTKLRVNIMLSQIRPHFLYNSLTAIRQLCDRDPAQAKQSILDFSRFLRANMNSLTTEEPIPFLRELEHTESYLNLEHQRFGKRLNVVYDTPVTDFMIPTLTLQPIVENAVRHGILKREEGGTVRIHTEEWTDGYLVVVSDDGVGFQAAQASQKGTQEGSHIGLANVENRLAVQCGGHLLVSSKDTGTTVTIWIPKEKK